MSHRLGISWGFNQEQQQVGQRPKTSSTADEEICINKQQNKGSVCELTTISWLITQTGCNWCIYQVRDRYWDVRTQYILTKFLNNSLSINRNTHVVNGSWFRGQQISVDCLSISRPGRFRAISILRDLHTLKSWSHSYSSFIAKSRYFYTYW